MRENPSVPTAPKYAVISRAGGRTRVALDLKDAQLVRPTGVVVPFRRDAVVSPGDTIVVPERTFTRPEIVQIIVGAAALAISALAVGYSVSRNP